MLLNRLLTLLFLFQLSVSAQTTTGRTGTEEDVPEETQNATDEEDLRRFWQLALPDGNFMVSLDRISSIAKSSYVLDGGLIVTEVTIDTVVNALCRIYQITPTAENGSTSTAKQLTQRARQLTDRASERTGADLANMVQKNYPTTTHAKTIEYRVQERSTLDALYGSLSTAWTQGRGRRFTIAK